MRADTEYERPPDEDEEEAPKRKRKYRRRAFAIVRVPWCYTPLKAYDDDNPDDLIEEFVAKGRCKWLEDNDPEKAEAIRKVYFERVNNLRPVRSGRR